MCSSSSEEEEVIEVTEIDSDSENASKVKKSTKNQKKPIMCRNISSFMAGHKRADLKINGIVDVSKVAKKKKHTYPFDKTRPKLCTMKHVIPFLYRPNNNTSFPLDALGWCINLHWFAEQPFKIKCWVYRS